MENHVHFITVPMEPDSMAKTFNTLHMRFSQHINKRHNVSGHVWQGRFFSCALDEGHLYSGIRYVENNPVRAKITGKADDYPWSSARSHIRGTIDPVLSNDCSLIESVTDWSAYLREGEDSRMTEAIQQNTRTGRPCGGEKFVLQLEALLGRRLNAMPRGRPQISNH